MFDSIAVLSLRVMAISAISVLIFGSWYHRLIAATPLIIYAALIGVILVT